MATYNVQWRYKSTLDGVDYVLRKGEKIDLTPAVAEYINLDSPGVLAPEEETRQQAPSQDRQLKAPPLNRAKKGLKSS